MTGFVWFESEAAMAGRAPAFRAGKKILPEQHGMEEMPDCQNTVRLLAKNRPRPMAGGRFIDIALKRAGTSRRQQA